MSFLSKTKGIGLLELMLSLAIIAILLIMATRYFQSASTNQKINQAVDEFNAIKGAAKNYYQSGTPKTVPTALYELVQAGYLPSSYGSTADTTAKPSPWNTAITLAPGAAGYLTVTMDTGAADVCTQVQQRIEQTFTSLGSESASCNTTTLTVNYSMN